MHAHVAVQQKLTLSNAKAGIIIPIILSSEITFLITVILTLLCHVTILRCLR